MTRKANTLAKLSQHIGYTFTTEQWLQTAITHRSVPGENNERLEFLGDAVLGAIISDALFHRFPQATEGQLSRLRSSLVRKESLANIAHTLHIGDFLQLGGGELKSGGKRRDSILADGIEAIIGAIYLDSGLPECKQCILTWFATSLDELKLDPEQLKDPKSRLQEYVQAKRQALPIYQIESVTGEPHLRQFSVRCFLQKQGLSAVGSGSSRRHAEQVAAAAVLALLQDAK